MKYSVYNLESFDESIEENNAYGQCLSKKYAERLQEDSRGDIWIGSISTVDIEKILEYYWEKDDVNNFIKENPEVASQTFIICRWDKNSHKDKYYEYCPIKEKRNLKISKLFN